MKEIGEAFAIAVGIFLAAVGALVSVVVGAVCFVFSWSVAILFRVWWGLVALLCAAIVAVAIRPELLEALGL